MKTQTFSIDGGTIHLLPTEDASILHVEYDSKELILERYPCIINTCKPQHIYLCSDEEIKKGDWCIFRNQVIAKATAILVSNIKLKDLYDQYQKIIFTTDPKLIADGVLPIPEKAYIEVK